MGLKYLAQPKNLIKGSCANAKAAAKRGALDKAGKPSADKRPGFTRAQASYNSAPYTYRKTEEASWECNQDGKRHKSRELCFQKCKKRGLGGPMIVDCIGHTVICLEATVKFTLDLEIEVYGLEWKTTCAEGERWNRQIRDHEQSHVNKINKLKRSAGKQSKEFKVCDQDEAKAKAELERQIAAFSATKREEFLATVQKQAEDFHGTAAGAKATLDCSKCRGG